MIVVDTSFVYALNDRRDRRHEEAVEWYRQDEPDLATTPLVLAEIDYLFATRLGGGAVEAWRRDVQAGAYLVEWWPGAERAVAEYAERYEGAEVDMTDASLAVLAARLETIRIATFDQRHFRTVRPLTGEDAFRLLPADA